MNPALLEYCYQMLKICASACHALLSMNECTTNLGVVEETQYSRLVCNICINVIHGVPCCRTNEPSVLYTCNFGCLQRLHPERRWQMFKRILVSRIKNDVHHPSADESKTIAKMPHPRAHYSYSVHVYVYGLFIQMYICMLYINSNSSQHCAYRSTTTS